jgi:hypothetical protein
MGKQQFIIPTEKDINSLSNNKFVIPTEKDINSLIPQKKNLNQPDMGLSGVKTSTDTNQEEDGFWGSVKGFAGGALDTAKWLGSTALGLAKGLEQGAVTVGQGLITAGSAMKNPYENMPGIAVDDKYKLNLEQRMKFAGQVNEKLEGAKFEKAKGNADFISLDKNGIKISAVDGEAFGEALGDNILQFGLNALGPTGVMLNFAKNFEQTYQEARKQGIPADRALVESAARGGIETYIEKKFGLESLMEKGLAQEGSKAAIKQITESVLTEKAFGKAAKEAIGLLNPKNIAAGFVKGFIPESAEEFVQTVADNGAQELFNYYEKSKNENVPEAKLDLYRNKDENGNDVPVEAWSKQTLVGGLNAAIYGGLMGQMGGTFINSRSWNPTIYSSLQNAYDGTGKQGLADSKVQLANGVKKALEKGTIDQAGHDAALRNLDLMEQNISTFDQNSEIPSYTRFQLFNIKNNVVPSQINQMASQFAEAVASKEKPTEDAINNDLENGNTTEFTVKGSIANAPSEFRQFIGKEAVEENGETVFKGQVPNSLIAANENNKTQIDSITQEAMTALSSLTDNERIVNIDDIKRLGQQGSPIFKDSRNQLAFEYAFQQNEKEFQRSARQINLLKSVAKEIETNKTPITKDDFQKKIENLYKFNTGDTVFVDNKSAKILEISNDGQKLKISGISEPVNASDPRISLSDEATQQIAPEAQAEQTPVEEQPVAKQEEVKPITEEEKITGRTMRDAVDELIPFTYRGETGEIYKQRNGVVVFESPNRVYEFGNIKDIGDKSIDEFDIIPQEMEIGDDFSVTIDGKTFTNKNQNPFKAITYDADGNAVSIKLDNDKGQTRVIKGTRAMLIDAKYKIKQLFNDATRDQLAAAADDAARQAAATSETTGESGQATTTTENKPVEQAPSIAQQERAARIREVAKRLQEQENPQTTQNKQSIASLANSLFSTGINVEVLSGDAIKAKYGKTASQGMFLSDVGTVVINEDMLPSEWGKTVIFHEGTHPIINIIRNVEPKLYKQLVAAAQQEAKDNPEVNAILQQIKNSKAYGDEFTRNDELVVEMIARVASGKLNLNKVKPSLKQAFIDFVNKIAKIMGLKPVLSDSDQVAFSRLANQISSTLNAGRDIAEIVGVENVTKFANENTQFRVNEVFEGILDQLGISAKGESKKGVTNYGVASALNKYYTEKFTKLAVDDFSENALKIVSDYATDEVIFAMQKFGDKSGKGWYTEDFASAVDKIAEIYPAIKEKEDVREIATTIIAIASNSTDVSTNLMRVIYGLDAYQKTGKIPSDIGTGKAMSAIATTINRYNRLLASFDNNPLKVKEFLQTIRPISESKKAIVEHLGVSSFAKVLTADYATNPDWDEAETLPTSILIFGPKIGAFYSNLSGLGGTPTIDRWCIRTMFRYRGDMRAKVLNVDLEKFIKANKLEGQAQGNVLALAEEHAKEFDRLLGGRGAYASLTKEQRNLEMSKYRQGKTIYSKSADVVNDIKDGLTDDIKNKAKFAKDFRTFTKDTFQKVQDNILETTGEKLDISDIQAILWIYEKNLFGFLGVKQREDATYSAAASRIVSSINNGNVSLNDVVNGTAKLADMKLDGVIEEGAMGDQYLINDEDFKNGIDANKGDTNIEAQYSDIDRTYTPESTAAAAGMTIKEREQWKEKNKVNQKQVRNPIVQKAASSLFDGDITLDDYINTVRENQPIKPFAEVPKLPSVKDIIGALDNSKLEKAGVVGVNRSFNDGDKVATRLDIPAYENYDTWVVSIHGQRAEGKDGQILAYGQTAVLKNVQFKTSAKGGIGIAIEKEKNTIARMWGDWTNESPESVHKRATELMNDPQWVQVGMNPFRHSFFYDKSTGEAVTSAEEVIQVGALVLAKNPVKAPFGSQAFIDNFSFKNKLGETIQFSDMNRDDKRIQFVRDNINNYSKSELTEGLMQAFNMSKDAAERIVAQATADPLAPSIPQDNPDTSIPKGAKLNQKSQTTEKYNSGYDKTKRALLEKTGASWEKVKKYVAEQYDSKFFGRRKLGQASSQESLAQARLRNLNGIAYSASQDLAVIYNDIFGNGLESEGERTLNAMIFNLRVLQVDANTEVKYADEIERLTLEFASTNNRMPSTAEAISISRQARANVPVKKHGKTLDGSVDATSATAQAYLDALRIELGESEYNMLKGRADMYRKVGNEQVAKLQAAGIISKEVADTFKDDFYSYRKTLERLYGEQDATITMLSGVASIKGWASLSKEGTENYLEQDARLLLAESYIGTARAIAKNKLRESIYEENIKVDEDGNESSVVDKNGNKITFIKPAVYIRDKDGNIRSNNKQLSVRDAEEGYVNVPYKKDGVINYFQMEREMFDQIEGNNIIWNDAKDSGSIANAYYWTTDLTNRILTGMATRKNPMFWIGNVPMDLQQQVFFTDIWTQGNVLQSNVYSAGARAFARTIKFSNFFGRNKEFVDNTLAEFIAAGGAMDRMSTMKEQRKRTIKVALNEGEKNPRLQMVKKRANAFFFGLNERTELAMRLAAYDQAKNNLVKKFKEENGTAPTESDMLKIQEIAASQARGYTDFAQRGTSLPNLNIAYLNSGIQAAGSALEYSVDNPGKIASKLSQLAIGKFAGTIALMALMGDAYDDLDEYTKDLYSFLYAFDTGMKDGNGKPVMVTADVKNNPSLVPFMGVTRTFAEMTMRHLQGKEQKEITAQGSADRFFELVNIASPIPVPNVTSLEGITSSAAKLVTKHTLLNAAVKAYGYDAFRGKNVISVADESLSPYMKGMNDKNVAYFYKAIAKSMANNSSANQISPAKMQAVAETFITSPATNGFVAITYGVLSSAANAIVPAESQSERGDYAIGDASKVIKSVTKRFASYTDSEKTEFRKNEELYKKSKEEAMKYNDLERNIDVKLKELYKNDPSNFFNNVDNFAKEKGFFDNIVLMERIDRKANLIDKNEYNRSFINENIANEVKIIHYTPGAEGKAKLLKYMFDKDATKARQVIDGMIDYGTSTKEAYDAEDLYLKSIK